MIKNTPKPKPDARYLAVQNRHAPSLEDVPHVRAALEQESQKATGRTLHVKPGKAGFEFLSPNRMDEDQTFSSVRASLSGTDEPLAYEFIWRMCEQINHDGNNNQEVRNAAADLAQHILYTQPMRKTHLQVADTQEMRQKLMALDDARKAQAGERRQQAAPTRGEKKRRQLDSLASFRTPLPSTPGIELESHTLDEIPTSRDKVEPATQPTPGTRRLRRRDRQAEPRQTVTSLDAGWETVNVEKALGGYVTSRAIRDLAVHTEQQLLQTLATRPLTEPEEQRLQLAASYLAETALPNTHWDPMTEVRLETPPPSGYFGSPKE